MNTSNEFDDILMDIFEQTKLPKAEQNALSYRELNTNIREDLEKTVFAELKEELKRQQQYLSIRESKLNSREAALNEREQSLSGLLQETANAKSELRGYTEGLREIKRKYYNAQHELSELEIKIKNTVPEVIYPAVEVYYDDKILGKPVRQSVVVSASKTSGQASINVTFAVRALVREIVARVKETNEKLNMVPCLKYKRTMEHADKIIQYIQPFVEAGMPAVDSVEDALKMMSSNVNDCAAEIMSQYKAKFKFKNWEAHDRFEIGLREINGIVKGLKEDLLAETKEYCEKLKRQTDIDCAKRRQLSAGIPGLPLPLDIRRVKHNWNPLPGEKRYNYVYRILFPTTGKEYIGKHSTNEWDDGYKGSGAEIQLMLQEDLNEAVKEILYMANSSDEAYYAESIILGTPGYLEHPNVYNKGVSRLRESDTTDKALWDSIVERIIPSKFINI